MVTASSSVDHRYMEILTAFNVVVVAREWVRPATLRRPTLSRAARAALLGAGAGASEGNPRARECSHHTGAERQPGWPARRRRRRRRFDTRYLIMLNASGFCGRITPLYRTLALYLSLLYFPFSRRDRAGNNRSIARNEKQAITFFYRKRKFLYIFFSSVFFSLEKFIFILSYIFLYWLYFLGFTS